MWRQSAQKFAVASKLKRQATLQCIFVEYCVSVSVPPLPPVYKGSGNSVKYKSRVIHIILLFVGLL